MLTTRFAPPFRFATLALLGRDEAFADVRAALRDRCELVVHALPLSAESAHALERLADAAVVRDDDGGASLAHVRRRLTVPVFAIASDGTADARARALELGADDTMSAPVACRELELRLGATIRRGRSAARRLRVGDLELTRDSRIAVRAGRRIGLSPNEFVLLWTLARHADTVVTKHELEAVLWGGSAPGCEARLFTTMSYLRTKVDRSPHERLIHTARGIGYMLSVQGSAGGRTAG